MARGGGGGGGGSRLRAPFRSKFFFFFCPWQLHPRFTLRPIERTSEEKPIIVFLDQISNLSIFVQRLDSALFGQFLASGFTACEICKSRLAYRTNRISLRQS